MKALRLLDDWPVTTAAAVVVDSAGERHSQGPVDRPLHLASMTKPLVALATLVAAEEGIVSLDEPCGPPGSSLRHLLSHSSGLSPDQRRLLTEPGTRRIYSNAAYELIADVIAERAEMGFDDYLHEAVFEPLGMTTARLDGSPASGVIASAVDVSIVVDELRRPDPQLVARETRVQLMSPVFPEITGVLPGYGLHIPNPWGLGVELRGAKSPHWTGATNSPATFGHFGRSGGFFWVDPQALCGVVVLTDHEFGSWASSLWPDFSDSVISEAGLRSSQG